MGDTTGLLLNDTPPKPRSKFTPTGFASFASLFVLLVVIGLQTFLIITMKERFPVPDAPQRPVNLDVAKDNVLAYYNSGMYDDDLHERTTRWLKYFNNRPVGPKDVIVFDIDDTVLSNYPEMKSVDFGYIPKLFDDWVMGMNATAIPETQAFYQELLTLNYTIVFLTGRHDITRNATIDNLASQGFTVYADLILRNPNQFSLTALDYKSGQREILVQQGWEIVGCIGDQWSDLDGGNAGYRMKVPNPCYYIA